MPTYRHQQVPRDNPSMSCGSCPLPRELREQAMDVPIDSDDEDRRPLLSLVNGACWQDNLTAVVSADVHTTVTTP
eukprot:6477519-Amphidinium_carterae.3